ncbi:uncharacterized protein MELLADRAFT_96027 [Melampsora larici-populina 98AG31]|uniref:Conserved oligomeric Golgi complex subunit 4 N-terminal domain-containing protein n=1 Tax=Melampsora larici-populina (strain 98AG31 / pathotype 3-4-7) TaxID=747676 RepID=F4SAM8_MELLP|nr:uncharacterized protein MELLADRAFT_96027 [Melampsora larici-populina 98AG31]EGF98294.1 hypothetical protein MELLADRAFT_96027 [Melampsora larici-populina 98AG31]
MQSTKHSQQKKHQEMEYPEDPNQLQHLGRDRSIAKAPLLNLPLPYASDEKYWDFRLPYFLELDSQAFTDQKFLNEVVTERATVAKRISSKVRILDLEQSRVKECIDWVQAVTELKNVLINTFQAIKKDDWEAATRRIQRANGNNPELTRSQFEEAVTK